MSIDNGGFGYIVVDSGAMRVDPPSWVIPHEYAHVVTAHQRGIIPNAWYETLANWFRDQYLGSDNYRYEGNIYGPDSDFFQPIILNSDYYFPHLKNYYDAWPFLLYITENPDNMNNLGLDLMKKLLHNNQQDTTIFDAFERLSGTSYKDMLGGYARRMVTLDFSRQSKYQKYLNELLADGANYSKIYTTLNSSSDGWLSVPNYRAPQQGGYNIVPLDIDLNSKQVVVNFKGTSTASEADWRASIVSKTRTGETRYSTMWNNGTNTLDLKGDETQVYLVVCATPDTLSDLTSFDENYVGTRYPYSIQVSTNNNISDSTEETPNTPDTTTPSISGNNIASKAEITTSACSSWENANALNDGYDPTSSNDRAHAVYGNWPETGTQWVKYTFDKNYTINGTDIYWFKDGAGIDVPSSYKIKYLDGNSWVEVPNGSGYGKSIDKYNSTSFSPITTNSIMIEMNSNGSYSTGILEWKVYGEEADNNPGTTTPIVTPDSGSSDTPSVTSEDIKVEMYNSLRNTLTNTISPQFKITNTSNKSLDLSKVTIRYYYTADGAISQNYWCDWSNIGNENVQSKFVNNPSSANTDGYIEIGFKSGTSTLTPGSSAFVNGRISKVDWSNYDQSNDFSFNSSASTYTEFNKISVYFHGQLVAGIEP